RAGSVHFAHDRFHALSAARSDDRNGGRPEAVDAASAGARASARERAKTQGPTGAKTLSAGSATSPLIGRGRPVRGGDCHLQPHGQVVRVTGGEGQYHHREVAHRTRRTVLSD